MCGKCDSCGCSKSDQAQLHVTVKVSRHREEDFFIRCEELGIQPLIIQNYTINGSYVEHLTSETIKTYNLRIAPMTPRWFQDQFLFPVIRTKIEVHPLHSEAPGLYFETHLKVRPPERITRTFLQELHNNKLFLSVNLLKPRVAFLTFRMYNVPWETYQPELQKFYETGAWRQYFEPLPDLKLISECAIIDTNPKLDQYWIGEK